VRENEKTTVQRGTGGCAKKKLSPLSLKCKKEGKKGQGGRAEKGSQPCP